MSRSIGGDGFRAWVDDLYLKRVETHARPEDVSFRCITEPLPADEVLTRLCRLFDVQKEAFLRRSRSCVLRAVAAYFLIRYSGLTQRDAASALNIGSGAAVCNQLKVLPDKLKVQGLQAIFQKADAEFKKMRQDRHGST